MIKIVAFLFVSICWVLAYQHMPEFTALIFIGWIVSTFAIAKL